MFALTHIGTAAMLLEIEGLRILTDPVFDPPGKKYPFGWGTGSKKIETPARLQHDMVALDAILLSHDQHADNLDDAGRALLPNAGVVLTTMPARKRLGGNARGLVEWESALLGTDNRVRVTAVPARHGPPFSLPFVGKTLGFVVEWAAQKNGVLYISGDTVFFGGVREIADRFRVDVAVLHLGSVRFPITGPFRYTFDGKDAVRAIREIEPRTIVPIHYEGWSHFRESKDASAHAFEKARVSERVRWITPGSRVELS